MKACIFIDGENLRHSLINLFYGVFRPDEYLPKTAQWEDFFDDLAKKAYNAERFRSYWYVVRNIDFFPYRLPTGEEEKLERVLSKDHNYKNILSGLTGSDRTKELDRMVNELNKRKRIFRNRFDGWKTIQDGISLHHHAVEFRRSGAISYNLFKKKLGSEKGVDVKLAVDLLELRDVYDVAVIVSGDQDYIPAVQVMKDAGKHVINVSFKRKDGILLPGGAWRLNKETDKALKLEYDEVFSFMFPSSTP